MRREILCRTKQNKVFSSVEQSRTKQTENLLFPVVKGPEPILREHPEFCGTNYTVLAGDHPVDGMVFRRGSIPFSRRILLIPTPESLGEKRNPF